MSAELRTISVSISSMNATPSDPDSFLSTIASPGADARGWVRRCRTSTAIGARRRSRRGPRTCRGTSSCRTTTLAPARAYPAMSHSVASATVTEHAVRWVFERVDPNTSGASGKIIDLFRNEGTPERGFLQSHAPGSRRDADGARGDPELVGRGRRTPQGTARGAAAFAIDFDFEDRAGERRDRLVDSLGLRELADTCECASLRRDEERETRLGIGTGDCLRDLDDGRAAAHLQDRRTRRFGHVRTLGGRRIADVSRDAVDRLQREGRRIRRDVRIRKGGTDPGEPSADRSRLHVLPCRAPTSQTSRGGYSESPTGDGTRYEGESLNGFARFGQPIEGDRVVPFENDAADAVAASLGLDVRDPEVLEQLGTTFLVVDPSVDRTRTPGRGRAELVAGTAREPFQRADHRRRSDRTTLPAKEEPSAARRSCEAFDHHVAGSTPTIGTSCFVRAATRPQGGETLELGTLVLVADPEGWSFPDESVDGSDRRAVARRAHARPPDDRRVPPPGT